jgi:hypothetical protein
MSEPTDVSERGAVSEPNNLPAPPRATRNCKESAR